MSPVALQLPGDSRIKQLAREAASSGGRILVVGGWVRDALAGLSTKDIDLEIYGLSESEVSALVRPYGFSAPVGRHFPVWRQTGDGLDLALPRAGNECFVPDSRAALAEAFAKAARHRDLTVNAMGWDPLDGSLIDPVGGVDDLRSLRLAPVDPETFATDPLRVLRAVRTAVRLGARFDASLATLCRSLDLSGLPVERIADELRRILTECDPPSKPLELLVGIDQLRVFPPLEALRNVPQDPRWHPEGDVFVHTNLVIDQASEIAKHLDADAAETLLWAALCHDLGKPETTEIEGDRVRSHGHEASSAERTREWLTQLRLAGQRVEQIATLVAHHLAPSQFVSQNAGPRAYRRLARKLAVAGVSMVDLERLARADHLGRTTPEALAGRFEAGVVFLRAAQSADVREGVRADVVPSSLVMRRGIPAGPGLGRILARCREVQDNTGWQDAERILERVLREGRGERLGKADNARPNE